MIDFSKPESKEVDTNFIPSYYDVVEDDKKHVTENKSSISNLSIDGIVKKDDYIFWCNVEVVENFVYKYLKDMFPDSLIVN